jgi:uncharacterized protein YjbJ (UPF0337 family)
VNTDNIKGNLEKLGGKLKETVGDLTGNEKLKNEGKLDQIKGTAHDALGTVKDHARDAIDSVKKLNE